MYVRNSSGSRIIHGKGRRLYVNVNKVYAFAWKHTTFFCPSGLGPENLPASSSNGKAFAYIAREHGFDSPSG